MTSEELSIRLDKIYINFTQMSETADKLNKLDHTPCPENKDFASISLILSFLKIQVLTGDIREETVLSIVESLMEIQGKLLDERYKQLTSNPMQS